MNTGKHFRKFGRGVFNCAVCGRGTREVKNGGIECCPECFEIAGLDNMVNDNGLAPESEEFKGVLAECEALLAAAVKKGGDAEKIKDNNGYIWG